MQREPRRASILSRMPGDAPPWLLLSRAWKWIEPHTIVFALEDESAGIKLQTQGDVRSMSMTHCVDKSLSSDEKEFSGYPVAENRFCGNSRDAEMKSICACKVLRNRLKELAEFVS